MSHKQQLTKLERILEEERRHLLGGDLSRLAKLAKHKESLLTLLKEAPLTDATLGRFAQLAERNQGLLAAAQDGIRSANRRLAEIQRGTPASTYSASGAKSEFSRPIRTLQRRA